MSCLPPSAGAHDGRPSKNGLGGSCIQRKSENVSLRGTNAPPLPTSLGECCREFD